MQADWSDDPVTPQPSWQAQHLVSNPIITFDGNKVTEDYGPYQTTFDQENYKRSPARQPQYQSQSSSPMSGQSTGSDSYYYNEDLSTVRDPGFGGARPRRRKTKRRNKYFLQDRRLLTEKYYPKEKYLKPLEDYYEETFYDDLDMAYSEPLITVEPSVETRQFTTVG